MIFLKSSGWCDSQSLRLMFTREVIEKRAAWLTIRSSSDGGSKNATKGRRDIRSNASSEGAALSNISSVSTSESSFFNNRCNPAGRYLFNLTQSTHQRAAARCHWRASTVAKCKATYGEKLQSRRRVGNP